MNNKLQFWTALVLALIGALAWTPIIINYLKPNKIMGKMISRYNNLDKDKTQTFFIFKLSILSKNKPFNLKQIKCEIEDLNGEKFLTTAVNNRLVVFTFEGHPHKLLLSGDHFLNNFTLFPTDKNIVGYPFFKFEGNLNGKLRATSFIFESFDNKIKKLKFDESSVDENQLFFDDTIWQVVDIQEIQNHPAIRSLSEKKDKNE